MSRFSPRNIMIHMIRLYQKYISPMKRTKCPYIPTCSQYGLEAIQKYGALKGGLLAVWLYNRFEKNATSRIVKERLSI